MVGVVTLTIVLFSCRNIDENDEYDLLDVEGHDKEEKYFDDEEPCQVSPSDSLVLTELCLDRRVLQDGVAGAAPSGVSVVTMQEDVAAQQDMPNVEHLSIS